MRFLHLADLHIGKKVNGFSMIEDQKYIFEKIFDVIEEKNVEAVIMAGDIYDKPVPSAEAVQLFDDVLTKLANLNLPVFVISGNHDSAERMGFGADILSAANIYMSKVYDGSLQKVTKKDEYGKINIYMLPFIKPANVRHIFKEEDINSYNDAVAFVVNREDIDTNERNIIISHQFVTGAVRSDSENIEVGGIDNIDVSNFDMFDYVALGHIHRPQYVGRENVRYAGTLLKYSFSEEAQEKSATIVDMREKGVVEIEEVNIKPLRDLKTVRGKFAEITDKSFYKDLSPEDYYRVILTDEEDVMNAIGRLKEVYPNIMCMDYDNTRTNSYSQIEGADIREDKKPLEYFKEFYELQNGTKMSDAQIEYVESLIEKIMEVQS